MGKLRVIAGRVKGRRLTCPPGQLVRPTAERVREAIFNIIADRLDNAIALDLFAGTGAMGIEALSRGAELAFFLDNSPAALEAITRNLRICGLQDSARVLRCDIRRPLACLKPTGVTFDLIFADPPYGCGYVAQTLRHLIESALLREGALLVVEHSSGEPPLPPSAHFQLKDRRKYGKTLASFLQYMA